MNTVKSRMQDTERRTQKKRPDPQFTLRETRIIPHLQQLPKPVPSLSRDPRSKGETRTCLKRSRLDFLILYPQVSIRNMFIHSISTSVEKCDNCLTLSTYGCATNCFYATNHLCHIEKEYFRLLSGYFQGLKSEANP